MASLNVARIARGLAVAKPGGSTVLTHRRVYVLPTRHGWTFFAVLLAMLVGAVNYNNNLGYLLAFLLGSLGFVSMFHTYRNLAGLSVRLRPGAPAFAGNLAHFVLYLDNREQRERPDLCVSFRRHADDERRTAMVRVHVVRDELREVKLAVQATRRGRVRMGRITIATRYPIGLFRAWSCFESDAEVLVYPSSGGDREIPTHVPEQSTTGGPRARGADDFAGLRNYVLGDSSRRVHWKSAAREQDMMVKQFTGATPHEACLRWAETPQPETEARLSQLCRWVLEADAAGARFSLELPGQTIESGRGHQHVRRCLRALALHGDAGA